MIVHSGSDEDTTIVATLKMAQSSKTKSSQSGTQKESHVNQKVSESRPNIPKGFQEYPNPIEEKERLVKAKALMDECQDTQVETRAQVEIKFPQHQKYPTHNNMSKYLPLQQKGISICPLLMDRMFEEDPIME